MLLTWLNGNVISLETFVLKKVTFIDVWVLLVGGGKNVPSLKLWERSVGGDCGRRLWEGSSLSQVLSERVGKGPLKMFC